MDEKKLDKDINVRSKTELTDEEIAKAILQQIEYGTSIPYINEWKQLKNVKFVDIFDFIHRLQENNGNQVRMRCDMQRKFDDLQNLCIEQKAEIERLTEEKNEIWDERNRICKGYWETVDECKQYRERNTELQKQVDELSQANIDLWNANQFGVKFAKNPYKGVEVE